MLLIYDARRCLVVLIPHFQKKKKEYIVKISHECYLVNI